MAKKPNPIRPRKKDEKSYERQVRSQFLDPFNAVLRSRLSQVESAKDALVELSKVEAMAVNPPTDVVRGELSKIDQYHMERTKKTFYSAFGIDVSSYLHGANVRSYLNEVVEENLELISSLPPRSVEGLRKKISDKIDVLPFDQKEFSELVDSEVNVSQSRLRLITRDQNNKFIGKLTEFRQNELGIQSYQWSTSGDARVRPSHRANDNRIFQWGKPPLTGNPGEDILCRCVAIPDLTNYDRDRLRGNATEQAEIVQEAPELTDVLRAQRLLDDIGEGRLQNGDLLDAVDEIKVAAVSDDAKVIVAQIEDLKNKRLAETYLSIEKRVANERIAIRKEMLSLSDNNLTDSERFNELKIQLIRYEGDSPVVKDFVNEFKGAQRYDDFTGAQFDELETDILYRGVAGEGFVKDNIDNGWLGRGIHGDGSYSAFGQDRQVVWNYAESGNGHIFNLKAKAGAKLIDSNDMNDIIRIIEIDDVDNPRYIGAFSEVVESGLDPNEVRSFIATSLGYDGINVSGPYDYVVVLNKRAFAVDQTTLPGGNRGFIEWRKMKNEEHKQKYGYVPQTAPNNSTFDEYEAWMKTNL